MSHDIDHSTGMPALAFVGDAPWHELGEKLPPGQPIETWLRAAKLEWKIQMLPVQYGFNGFGRTMDDRFVLVRDDTGKALSVVSGEYQVVQPAEILEFYRELVEKRHYTLETAGALDGGRKVWALARTGLVADVAGNAADQLGAYVLLATSCDKSIATTATFTSIRVVCQNTLSFAFNDMKNQQRRNIKVDHTRKFDHSYIHESLGLVDHAWSNFMGHVNPMATREMNDQEARKYFERIFLSEQELAKGKTLSDNAHNEINQIMSLFKSARGQNIATASGTLWGAVNAVTHFTDHVRSPKSVERIDSAWFGAGTRLKAKAWEQALSLCGPLVDQHLSVGQVFEPLTAHQN